jgi:hypothetical protein
MENIYWEVQDVYERESPLLSRSLSATTPLLNEFVQLMGVA